MNKKLILGMACFGLVLTISACGTAKTPTVAGNNSSVSRRPDYGQPATQPEIRGLVKSVVGNEVTVLKIDRPQGATSTATSTASDTKTPMLSLTGGTGGAGAGGRPAGGFAGGGNRPGGPAGGTGGPGGGTNTATDRTAMLERMKAMSTGEEKVIIPVGIQMLKADSSNTGKQRAMVEATISDITADKSLTIWLDASITDKKVASFVMIN